MFDKLKALLELYTGTGIQAPIAVGVSRSNVFNAECSGGDATFCDCDDGGDCVPDCGDCTD